MTAPTPQYNPNVPQNPSDTLDVTQRQLLANFQAMFNAFLVNHVSLTGGATAGNHTIVQLLEQDSDPQTDTSEISVYVKEVEGQTDQIFLKYQGNAGQVIQLTNYQIYALPQTPTLSQFFTFLPGKLLVYFGSFSTLQTNVLNLFPAIAKNIMTISLCPNLPQNFKNLSYKPSIKLITPDSDDGFYDKIKLVPDSSGIKGSSSELPPCFYIIIANI
jgi:hypothetical protein